MLLVPPPRKKTKAKTRKAAENERRRRAGNKPKPGHGNAKRPYKYTEDCGPFSNIETLEQARKIAEMKVSYGYTFRQIAEELGVHHSTVSEAFYKLLGWVEGEAYATAEEVREVESLRLEDLYKRAIEGAENATSIQGPEGEMHEDPAARVRYLQTALKVSESRRKLWGVDQPDKHEHLGKDGAALALAAELAATPDEELDREIAGFQMGIKAGEDRAEDKMRRKKREADPVEETEQAPEQDQSSIRGEAPEPQPEPEPSQARGKPMF